jgi:hypothetical protein
VQRVPIVPCPAGDFFFIRGVRVDTNYYSGPRCIAVASKSRSYRRVVGRFVAERTELYNEIKKFEKSN